MRLDMETSIFLDIFVQVCDCQKNNNKIKIIIIIFDAPHLFSSCIISLALYITCCGLEDQNSINME